MKIAMANLLMRPNRNKPASDVEEELQFHIEMLERKYAQQGMCVADAKAAALKRFGNLERVKRQCVDISSRNNLLRRVLKTSAILIALIGLSINILGSDYKIARIWQLANLDRHPRSLVTLRARFGILRFPSKKQRTIATQRQS